VLYETETAWNGSVLLSPRYRAMLGEKDLENVVLLSPSKIVAGVGGAPS